jgi:CubicO group peptidase (beta-lactamase class C family)
MKNKTIGRSLFIIFGIVLLLVAPCAAQDAIKAKVDDFIKTEMQKQRIPGVSLAVVKNGQIILAKGYGLANVEHQVPVKPETIFQSASVGKQFTATAVMMLVEEGKIALDEKIGKYLGEVPESWKNITVQHLLTHTSGLADDFPDEDFRLDFTEAEILKRAEALPLDFQPGEKWSYSSIGYKLLGILIGKVTGKFYGDFLQERIFKPLNMTTARIISEADIVPNRAAGYRLVNGELKNQYWISPTMNTTADGSLYLTALDMAKWDAALYGEKLVKKTSLEQMWTPVKLNDGRTYPYGFGWAFGKVNGHRIIEHSGSWQGFKSFIARYPDDRLSVIVFANLWQTNPGTLAHEVAAIYDAALSPHPIEDKEPQMTAMVKELLKKIAADSVDQTALTPRANLSKSLKALGELKEIQLIERKNEDALRLYRYRLVYSKGGVLLFTVNVNKEGKVVSVSSQAWH